jgi:hypothetical protein
MMPILILNDGNAQSTGCLQLAMGDVIWGGCAPYFGSVCQSQSTHDCGCHYGAEMKRLERTVNGDELSGR